MRSKYPARSKSLHTQSTVIALYSCMLAVVFSIPAQGGAESGLVAYYPLDGSPMDASGNGHNGTLYNATATSDRSGRPQGALRFNGSNSYINIGTGINPQQFSIMAWVWLDSLAPESVAIVSKLHNLSPNLFKNFELRVEPDGRLQAHIPNGVPWWPYVRSDRVLSTQAWQHVALTYDGTVAKLYIDGTSEPSALYGSYAQSDVEITIGARPEGGNGGMPSGRNMFFPGRIDDVRIYNRALSAEEMMQLAQDEGATARSLPEYQYDGARGPQTIKDLRSTTSNGFSFVFATTNVGARCLVSWTTTLREWFALIGFDAITTGTEVSDTTPAPQTFYRTIYLPAGVIQVDGFDYPIGDRGVNGDGTAKPQGVPEFPAAGYAERNNLFFKNSSGKFIYPAAEGSNPDRGQLSGTTTEWRNVQDVGSYLAGYGIHVGEDWNIGSGSYDAGQPVTAIANGQVIDIRPANQAAGLSVWGWRMLVRHWLPNGDTVDSIYVHIAPDKFEGDDNANGDVGNAASEPNFSFQEGSAVPRGAIIGVVGNIAPPAPGAPHLHLEIRDTKTDPANSWPRSNGNGYYGTVSTPGTMTPEEVQSAFDKMREDGILDPSDFIDDHRRME